MADRDRDRIENAIRHIQTAVDVDPWAVEIAVDAIETQISSSRDHENDPISRQAAIDALEKCMTCKHVYQRKDDADTIYCRCRKGCRYEEYKPKRSNRSSQGHEN